MSTLIEQTYELANGFMREPRHVTINLDEAKVVANTIEKSTCQPLPLPSFLKNIDGEKRKLQFLAEFELMAASINYCYWYGKHDVRIDGASATKMYKMLEDAWDHPFVRFYANTDPLSSSSTTEVTSRKIVRELFVEKLRLSRIPLVEDRIRHIDEVVADQGNIASWLVTIASHEENGRKIDDSLSKIVRAFSGFASDPFLKRAFLFLMQMHRRVGWYAQEIQNVPIPADYQIPKVLASLGVIKYSDKLISKIANHELIGAGSLEECEIRAASILACQEIAIIAKTTCEFVDNYLWTRRHDFNVPFHLTVTTAY